MIWFGKSFIKFCATPGAAKEGAGGQKRGISAALGTVKQKCVFNGSDLDGPCRLTPT